MLQSIDTLLCAVPSGQPLPRERGGRVFHDAPKTLPLSSKCSAIQRGVGGRVLPKQSHDRRPDGLKLGSCDAVMVDLVLRPQGATRAEMREALGWKSDPYPSMMAACDKAGVEVSVLRPEGEQFRYCGRYQ